MTDIYLRFVLLCLLCIGFLVASALFVFAWSEPFENLTGPLHSFGHRILGYRLHNAQTIQVSLSQSSYMAGRLITTWALAVCGGTALATNLYTTHYGGNVSTLSLTECNGSYTLTKTHTLKSCGMMPSWLTYDTKTEILYCSDENSPNGTLTTYAVAEDGAFTELAEVTTIAGGVNSVEYGGISGNSFLAIAH